MSRIQNVQSLAAHFFVHTFLKTTFSSKKLQPVAKNATPYKKYSKFIKVRLNKIFFLVNLQRL